MITEEMLMLYYYDELSDIEKRKVESAIKSDNVLAARYASLSAELGEWSEPAETKAPEHLRHRWHDSIDQAARSERASKSAAKPTMHMMSFVWGAAATAAIALAVAASVYFTDSDETLLPVENYVVDNPAAGAELMPASFNRGLQVYLRDSRDELAHFDDSDGAGQALLVLQIIEQNRLFERVATQNDSQNVARVLRAFEPILLQLASDDIAPADAEALRAQLSFELSVMLTKLARDTSKDAETI